MVQDKISAVTYATSGTVVVLGLTVNEIAALTGALVAVATFIVNTVFKWRADRRARGK